MTDQLQTAQDPNSGGSPANQRSVVSRRVLHTIGAWCAGVIFAGGCVRAYWDGYAGVAPWRSLTMMLVGGLLIGTMIIADLSSACKR